MSDLIDSSGKPETNAFKLEINAWYQVAEGVYYDKNFAKNNIPLVTLAVEE